MRGDSTSVRVNSGCSFRSGMELAGLVEDDDDDLKEE
jgi:hypothetical protein